MRSIVRLLFRASLALLPGAAVADSAPPPSDALRARTAANFDVQKLAEGVYAVVRRDPPGLMVDANDLFIIGDNDVVVVDTSGAPQTTRAVLAALRRITKKPVRYVINTHWHDDHISGNRVYREAFPEVDFIGSAAMAPYLSEHGAKNREAFLTGAPQVAEQMRQLLADGKNFADRPISDEERVSYASDLALLDLALHGAPEVQVITPTIAVSDVLTLRRGAHPIEIRHVGNAHTAGDLIVWLPTERIVATGDAVVWPIPLVGGDQSYVAEWSATLDRIVALKPAIVVPGHGPVMRDTRYLEQMSALFSSIVERVNWAVAGGAASLDEVRKQVDLSDFARSFAGDSSERNVAFAMYVKGPAVESAYRAAKERKATPAH